MVHAEAFIDESSDEGKNKPVLEGQERCPNVSQIRHLYFDFSFISDLKKNLEANLVNFVL